MKEEYEPLAEDLKTYSDGLIQALKTGRHHDGLEYVGKMTQHIAKIKEYLEIKKIIAKQIRQLQSQKPVNVFINSSVVCM